MVVRGFQLPERAALAPAVVSSVWIPAERFVLAQKKAPGSFSGPRGAKDSVSFRERLDGRNSASCVDRYPLKLLAS